MPRTPWKNHPCEARIADILPGSIAEELTLQPGDLIRAVNGVMPTDFIAYRFATAEEEVALEVERDGERVVMEIEKDADEDLGIVFTGDVFDGVRPCRNKCIFCFEDQIPDGMRSSLRLRDDDFRLSFLHGNFLTLTNLSDDDMARIIREHLSPLFISIHATDLDVRRQMLRNRRAPDIREQLRELGEGGIEVHAQIVLCPGWNDGQVLEDTLRDLAALHPTVVSVGIVPVGLTGHRPAGSEIRAITADDAAAVLDCVTRWQAELLPRLGTRLVFAADEFYLCAGREIPDAEAYEDFVQQENGIGLARLFLDDMAMLDDVPLPSNGNKKHVTIATGTLAAPLLEQLAARLREQFGVSIDVLSVPNLFYGGGVSVAGLLTGSDFLAALRNHKIGDVLVLPAVTLNTDGVFLDDMTPKDLMQTLHVPIRFCADPFEVSSAIAE